MTTYTYTKEELSLASNYIDHVNSVDDSIRGIAAAIITKLGTNKKPADSTWQAVFKPFQDIAQARAGAEDATLVPAVRTMKSRVRGLLTTDYSVVIAAPIKSASKDAKTRAASRAKEAETLAPIKDRILHHATANDLSPMVATAELADKKADSKDKAQVLKAGKQLETDLKKARQDKIVECRKVVQDFLKDATKTNCSDANYDTLQTIAALIEGTIKLPDDLPAMLKNQAS